MSTNQSGASAESPARKKRKKRKEKGGLAIIFRPLQLRSGVGWRCVINIWLGVEGSGGGGGGGGGQVSSEGSCAVASEWVVTD